VFVATERAKRGKKRKIMNVPCVKRSQRGRERERENYFFES